MTKFCTWSQILVIFVNFVLHLGDRYVLVVLIQVVKHLKCRFINRTRTNRDNQITYIILNLYSKQEIWPICYPVGYPSTSAGNIDTYVYMQATIS